VNKHKVGIVQDCQRTFNRFWTFGTADHYPCPALESRDDLVEAISGHGYDDLVYHPRGSQTIDCPLNEHAPAKFDERFRYACAESATRPGGRNHRGYT
jgi:hypothetical protein